jgi:hypothetical protein
VGVANSGTSFTATLEQQMILGGGAGWYYSYPGVAVNNAGTAVVPFMSVSTSSFLSATWAAKTYSATSLTSVTYLQQGTCLRDATFQSDSGRNPQERAGDYSGAAADPDGTRLWIAAERSTAITGVGCGWQTWIGAITP